MLAHPLSQHRVLLEAGSCGLLPSRPAPAGASTLPPAGRCVGKPVPGAPAWLLCAGALMVRGSLVPHLGQELCWNGFPLSSGHGMCLRATCLPVHLDAHSHAAAFSRYLGRRRPVVGQARCAGRTSALTELVHTGTWLWGNWASVWSVGVKHVMSISCSASRGTPHRALCKPGPSRRVEAVRRGSTACWAVHTARCLDPARSRPAGLTFTCQRRGSRITWCPSQERQISSYWAPWS